MRDHPSEVLTFPPTIQINWGHQAAPVVEKPLANVGDTEPQVRSLSLEDPRGERMATHFTVLAWRIPWTEELDGLQSTGLQRVGYDGKMEHTDE